MSFTKVGSTEKVTGTTHSHTTHVNTLIGDLIHLQAVVDGGSVTMTPDAIFGEATIHLRHTVQVLGKQSWWAVAIADGETTYDLTGVNSSIKSTQTVYRNSIGGGTWALGSINDDNTSSGGSFTLGGVTSLDNSLVVFSTTHDDNAGVTTPPSSMTEAAPNPTGGDTVGLRSYFEDITTGKAESQNIVYASSDAIIGDLSVFTYTISGGAADIEMDIAQTLNSFTQSIQLTEISDHEVAIAQVMSSFTQSVQLTEISDLDIDIGQNINSFTQSIQLTEISDHEVAISQNINSFTQSIQLTEISDHEINITQTLNSFTQNISIGEVVFNPELLFSDIKTKLIGNITNTNLSSNIKTKLFSEV